MLDTDRIRRFNRFYLHHMGLLSRFYLDTGLPVSELRILYELMEEGCETARAIAQRLGLDEAYVSRSLKKFAAEGWLTRAPSPDDARQKVLVPTEAGRAAWAPVVARTRQDVGERIPAHIRQQVANRMAEIEALLTPISRDTVTLRHLESGDAGWIIQRHAEHYKESDGFDERFETLVAQIVTDFCKDHDPARERVLIATHSAMRLGSIFVVQEPSDPQAAKLRLFYLVPEARGLGLGSYMLEQAISFARAAGYRRMTLWTHESHRAAGRLYATSGFTCVRETPEQSYGQSVIVQHWQRDL